LMSHGACSMPDTAQNRVSLWAEAVRHTPWTVKPRYKTR
jgi:hypothetical protein